MNKSKGNMYTDITHTWNPLAGKCSMNCSYCSTKRLAKRYPGINIKYSGKPRIIEKEMSNLGENNFIFVVAQNDLFASTVDTKDIIRIHSHLKRYPKNKYLIQSKNTCRMEAFYHEFNYFLSDNIILCTTLENDGKIDRAKCFKDIEHPYKHVTIEPIFKFNHKEFVNILAAINPEQINIGANSNHNLELYSEPTWIEIHNLVVELKERMPNTRLILKDNLKRLYDGKTNN